MTRMAYKVTTTGMDELEQKLRSLGDAAQGVAAAGLYEGAGVMADAVSRAVHGIATSPFRYAAGGQKRKPSQEEKALLENAQKGVAKFRKNGLSVDTSVGLSNAGYGQLGNETKPIPLIANAINSGTSFMQKQPFFRKAVSQAKAGAVSAIDGEIQKRIEEIMNE